MEKALTLGSGIMVGFEKIHIIDYLNTGAVKNHFVIEGRKGEGASQKLEIEGLAKEPTSVAGSNVGYYLSRKGVGKTTANVTLLDLPFEIENEILGRKVTESGIALVGNDTEAPYTAIVGESETANGDKVYVSLLRGVFRREKFELNTTDPNEDFKPEGVEYGFSAENLKSDNSDFDGQVFAYYIGSEEGGKSLFEALGVTDDTPTTPVNPTVPVTGVTGSQATASIKVGATKQVTGTVTPSDATNKAVTYASDAELIATVAADGTITGVAEGTANITITSVDGGFTAKVAVTVSAA